jgi:hypothetical protein
VTQEQKLKIAAVLNAQGFDKSLEVVDLPYLVTVSEWKKRHGDALLDTGNEVLTAA